MTESKKFGFWETQADKFISACLCLPVFIVLLLTALSYIGVKLFFSKQEIIHLIETTCK